MSECRQDPRTSTPYCAVHDIAPDWSGELPDYKGPSGWVCPEGGLIVPAPEPELSTIAPPQHRTEHTNDLRSLLTEWLTLPGEPTPGDGLCATTEDCAEHAKWNELYTSLADRTAAALAEPVEDAGFWGRAAARAVGERKAAEHDRDTWREAKEEVSRRLTVMTAARDEAIEIANYLNTFVPKFPATGGPTQTERRLAELAKVV